jgi:threonine synthase
VLTDFIRTGTYNRSRAFVKTISPSMDILISSNLERLLYHITGRDHVRVCQWMADLNKTGCYHIDELTNNKIQEILWSDYADDKETIEMIGLVYQRYGYIMDTHTAVGMRVHEKYTAATGDITKTVVVSTASPFKFNESVVRAILGDEAVRGRNELSLLQVLSNTSGLAIPAGLKDLDRKPALHKKITARDKMAEVVMKILLD